MSLIARVPLVQLDGRLACSMYSLRGIAAVPATGKRPPPLEEFDPLNPGDWQLGVGSSLPTHSSLSINHRPPFRPTGGCFLDCRRGPASADW
jgi:hypothetical protein